MNSNINDNQTKQKLSEKLKNIFALSFLSSSRALLVLVTAKTKTLKTAKHQNLVSLNIFQSIIAIVFSSFVFASIANAADYYVATTGSDSYTAVQASNYKTPWKTIQKAAANVGAGATVHIAPGIYNTNTYNAGSWPEGCLLIGASGTSSARITFISDTKWGASLQGSPSDCIVRLGGKYIDFINFEVTKDSGAGPSGEGILINGSYNRVIGNKIHDFPGSGVIVWDTNYTLGSDDIIGNLVYNVGIPGNALKHGIYISTPGGGNVSDNIVINSKGFGIHAWHAARNYTISNNLVSGSGYSGIIVGNGDAPFGTVADNFIVTNNISINNGIFGIVEGGFTGLNNIYKNNLVYGNSGTGFSLQNGNTSQNTITADPKFVNFKSDGTGDYHLSSTSPAINAGVTLGTIVYDFGGPARTGTPNIGPNAN